MRQDASIAAAACAAALLAAALLTSGCCAELFTTTPAGSNPASGSVEASQPATGTVPGAGAGEEGGGEPLPVSLIRAITLTGADLPPRQQGLGELEVRVDMQTGAAEGRTMRQFTDSAGRTGSELVQVIGTYDTGKRVFTGQLHVEVLTESSRYSASGAVAARVMADETLEGTVSGTSSLERMDTKGGAPATHPFNWTLTAKVE